MNLHRLLPTLIFLLFTTVASAQELTWNELASRQEFWPTNVTINRAMKFGNGGVSSGQKLELLAIHGNQVEVATADGLSFNVKPEDTDTLALARATWGKLTPAQRAITYSSLLQHKDLWPYRVKVLTPVNLNTGTMKPGESVILMGVEGNELLLLIEKGRNLFTLPPRSTDLLAQAQRLAVDKEAFPGRVTSEIQGKLVDPVTSAAVKLEGAQPRYYAFYRGASWCGPCRQFSPSLVKFYKTMKPEHPEFEIIYLSGDKSPAEMKGYAQEAGFNWRAIPQTRQGDLQIVTPFLTQYIPQFIVLDRQGNLLINSAQLGGPDVALKKFDALLKKPR